MCARSPINRRLHLYDDHITSLWAFVYSKMALRVCRHSLYKYKLQISQKYISLYISLEINLISSRAGNSDTSFTYELVMCPTINVTALPKARIRGTARHCFIPAPR